MTSSIFFFKVGGMLHLLVVICAVASPARSSGYCNENVCSAVYDAMAEEVIQLEPRQTSPPPITEGQLGLSRNTTQWTCLPPEEAVQLAFNGTSHGEGRVEMLYSGEWGSVCNTTWDIQAADIACNQLGLPSAAFVPASGLAVFGEPSGPVWVDGIDCNGKERSLYRCKKQRVAGIPGYRCPDGGGYAGVVCDLPGQLLIGNRGGNVSVNQSFLLSGASRASANSTFRALTAVNDSRALPTLAMALDQGEGVLYAIQVGDGESYSSIVVDEVDGLVFWSQQGWSKVVKSMPISGSLQQPETVHQFGNYPKTLVMHHQRRHLFVLLKHSIRACESLPFNQVAQWNFHADMSCIDCAGLALDEPGGKAYFSREAGFIYSLDIDDPTALPQRQALNTAAIPGSTFVISGWLVWLERTEKRVGRLALRGGTGEVWHQDIGDLADDPHAMIYIPD